MGNSIGKSTMSNITLNEGEDMACFGAGCYWGTEKYFKKDFNKYFPSAGNVVYGKVGFMGPTSAKENPTYQEVCSGITGHVEVYNLKYTGGAETYESLVKFFFQFHDPTTLNRQGNDQGTQYSRYLKTMLHGLNLIYTYSS